MSTRRRTTLACTVTLTAAAVTAAVLLRPAPAPEQPPAHGTTTTAAQVARQTLTTTSTVAGLLGYGTPAPVASKASGTVTWLPEAGATIERGKPVLRADNLPVMLLYGELPVYRSLGLDAKGPDVEQFERNLAALGYTGFTVDETFSAGTVAALKRWQKALGRPESGQLTADQVVYAAGPLRIAARSVRVGEDAAGEVLTATGPTRLVTSEVRTAEAGWAVPGRQVEVTVPGGRPTTAVVASVGTAATAGRGGGEGGQGAPPAAGQGAQSAIVTVTLTVADQQALGTMESGPVDIRYAGQERKDVLTVPVAALLALAEGGYGLELAEGDGPGRVVPVTTGLFTDALVEVSGPDLSAGLTVRLPR